jgi:hypothetical protein
MSTMKSFTSKQYLSQLNLIYFAQAGVLLVFAAVVFGLVYSGSVMVTAEQSQTQMLSYLLIAVVVAGFSASYFIYRFQLSKIDKSLELKKKMPKFIGVLLIRSACMELPGLLACVVFFMTGNYYLLFIPVFTALVFFLLRPTTTTIAEDLALNEKEKAQLNNPDAIIADR